MRNQTPLQSAAPVGTEKEAHTCVVSTAAGRVQRRYPEHRAPRPRAASRGEGSGRHRPRSLFHPIRASLPRFPASSRLTCPDLLTPSSVCCALHACTVLCSGEWLTRIASHRNAGASGIHHTTDAGSNVHAGLEASRRVPPRDLLGRQAAEVRADLGECSVPSTVFSYV